MRDPDFSSGINQEGANRELGEAHDRYCNARSGVEDSEREVREAKALASSRKGRQSTEPTGIEYVLVNGKLVVERGKRNTKVLAGKVLCRNGTGAA